MIIIEKVLEIIRKGLIQTHMKLHMVVKELLCVTEMNHIMRIEIATVIQEANPDIEEVIMAITCQKTLIIEKGEDIQQGISNLSVRMRSI